MRLTQFSDIGLRVLIYLAGADKQRALVTVGEIARQFDIPANHLVKVVGHLARMGWIQASRGRHGGLRLLADPATLHLGTVLRELEGDAELVDCEGQNCRLSKNCELRSALAAGLRAFYDAMDRYVLADVTAGAVGEQIIVMHRNFLGSPVQSTSPAM
ncbi:MAG: BadM/Rrf2 family transcriptional regulator [Burkholderia sp.]|jgi:Rrf2 family nitric oxide-sensitive transcriptional repressor|nr:BadM/Rrf2 family transcriptional regulator [Burkholderia sp.]